MRSTHWVSDYRLAVYVVVAAVVGGVVAFALDRATAPTAKIEANVAPATASGVRQIPISRTSAADLGDPDGKLSPVYPAAPGKDLPVKDTPIVQAAKPPAETTGNANAGAPAAASPPPPAAPVAAATPVASATSQPANACNIAACAAAYRSFRESDCTYQPFEGPRKYCEGAPAAAGQAASQPAPPPQSSAKADARGAAPPARSRYDDELRDVERAVRRLPPPGRDDDDTVVVIESPQQRYDIRRNWISEPQD
jgi:hypothetical protein